MAPQRINPIIDFPAVERLWVSGRGTHAMASAAWLAELAQIVATGDLEMPIARSFALADVREAFTELAERHSRGKIVLLI